MNRPIPTLLLSLTLGLGGAAAPTFVLAQPAAAGASQQQLAWNKRTAESLRAALREANRHGLDATPLLKRIDSAKGDIAYQTALNSAALTYARALSTGAVDPDKLFGIYTLDRPTSDLSGGLARALQRGDVRGWLESLAPQDAEYKALSQAYLGASGERAMQLAANLERRRWLARGAAARRIDVNTAANFLHYIKGGEVARRVTVVTGKTASPTPQIGSTMTRLVVNPPWNVPEKIARNEILPKGRGYLRANNMYVTGGRVVQRPGPSAALGLVKFDLDNPYAIYLHDTPSKKYFESADRHRSHGCVRVKDAVEFARMLAEEDGMGAEFEEDLGSGDTATVNISDLPVRLLYHTAYLDESGQVAFAADAYGWDKKVAAALKPLG
ncbi:MAG TPA: L,D-transpeptidase family protein [Caulobacteraceae bacterium]|nr:L,D-transpeptidase family protein [Caulobacteraceae bacterium]